MEPQCWKRNTRSRKQSQFLVVIDWNGSVSSANCQAEIARLYIVVPIAIALICLLLFVNFGSFRDMLLAASVMPMALIGGIFAL